MTKKFQDCKMHSVDLKPERQAELFSAYDKAEKELIEAKARVLEIKEKSQQ